jgi:hypothetical protein
MNANISTAQIPFLLIRVNSHDSRVIGRESMESVAERFYDSFVTLVDFVRGPGLGVAINLQPH